MLSVPLYPVPSQTLSIILAGQNVNLSLYTESTGLFMDVELDNEVIALSRVVEDGARILQDVQYKGFVGDFVLVDTQGELNPVYTGLGARWQLVYLEAADLVAYGGQ